MNKKEVIKALVNRSATLIENNKLTFKDIYNDFMNLSPNNVAMIYHRSDDVTREYTYEEYNRLVISTAKKISVLLEKINKGEIVALKLKNTPTWCIIFWAILMAGYIPLLIDAKLPSDNAQILLKNSGAKAIITDEGEYSSVIRLTRNDIHAANEDNFFEPVWANEVIFCSSGTTGNIKLMVFNGDNMVHQLDASRHMMDENLDIIYPQSLGSLRLIALIPFHHIFAFVSIFLWYNFYNATIVFTSFIDPITIVEDIRRYKVTHIYHVPLFYEVVTKNFMHKLDDTSKALVNKLIDYNLKRISRRQAGLLIEHVGKKVREKLFGNQVRYCISGGGYLNDKTCETMNGLGYALYNGYGMTEVGVTSVELSTDVIERIKRSIGHPLHEVTYKIDNNGELLIKSPYLHYREIIDGINRRSVFDENGFFRTGDIAKEINGRYYILGRLKDTIIASNGENVYPDEIESYFRKIKGINNLAVFGSSNRIVMVVEGDNELISQINEINRSLPIHKQVNDIVFVDEPLPLSSSMKVKRFEVKRRFESKAYEVTKTSSKKDILVGYDTNLKNKVISRLQGVFKKVLFVEKDIPVDGHWINDLHSDSMTYISLVAEIEKEFNYKFPIELYGKLTCLNDFAKEILDSICK